MADGPFQLTPPFSNWRYKPPLIGGDQFKLSLTPPSPPVGGWLGWVLQARTWQTINLGYTLPDMPLGTDTSLTATMAAVARVSAQNPTATSATFAPIFTWAADNNVWDALAKALSSAGQNLWTDVPSARPNLLGGGMAPLGKVDAGGSLVLTNPDDLVSGWALPTPALSLGRRFAFISEPDVHFYLYMDRKALPSSSKYLLSGAGIDIEGTTSWGTKLTLSLGAGRDDAGGGAGFLTVELAPAAKKK
jgi:hypothetical protein